MKQQNKLKNNVNFFQRIKQYIMNIKFLNYITLYNNIVLLYISHGTKKTGKNKRAQRARDRARLGDKEYKQMEAKK